MLARGAEESLLSALTLSQLDLCWIEERNPESIETGFPLSKALYLFLEGQKYRLKKERGDYIPECHCSKMAPALRLLASDRMQRGHLGQGGRVGELMNGAPWQSQMHGKRCHSSAE